MRRFFNLVVLALLVWGLASTNPTKAEYVAWAKERQMAQAQNVLSKAAVALLSSAYIDSTTTAHNYIVLTVFETQGFDGRTRTVVGCLKNFFPLTTK